MHEEELEKWKGAAILLAFLLLMVVAANVTGHTSSPNEGWFP